MPIPHITLLSSPPFDAFAILMHLVSSHSNNKNVLYFVAVYPSVNDNIKNVLYFVAVYPSVNDDDVMSENEDETEDDAFKKLNRTRKLGGKSSCKKTKKDSDIVLI